MEKSKGQGHEGFTEGRAALHGVKSLTRELSMLTRGGGGYKGRVPLSWLLLTPSHKTRPLQPHGGTSDGQQVPLLLPRADHGQGHGYRQGWGVGGLASLPTRLSLLLPKAFSRGKEMPVALSWRLPSCMVQVSSTVVAIIVVVVQAKRRATNRHRARGGAILGQEVE